MILVTLTGSTGRQHCVLSRGSVSAESESASILGALVKAYIGLLLMIFDNSISKWRKIWTER